METIHEPKNRLFRKICYWAVFAIIIFLLPRVIINICYVPSESMENTLAKGNLLIGNRLVSDFHRGDILVFKSEEGSLYVKRLIGLPGERVEISDNRVYIDGTELHEPYLKEPMQTEDCSFDVPDDEYLFFGDNRNNSYDARFWDYPYIKKEDIKSRIFVRIWPFPKARIYQH